MNKVSRGCGSQYMDCFKRKLVADSRADGMNASMLAKKHVVEISQHPWLSLPQHHQAQCLGGVVSKHLSYPSRRSDRCCDLRLHTDGNGTSGLPHGLYRAKLPRLLVSRFECDL